MNENYLEWMIINYTFYRNDFKLSLMSFEIFIQIKGFCCYWKENSNFHHIEPESLRVEDYSMQFSSHMQTIYNRFKSSISLCHSKYTLFEIGKFKKQQRMSEIEIIPQIYLVTTRFSWKYQEFILTYWAPYRSMQIDFVDCADDLCETQSPSVSSKDYSHERSHDPFHLLFVVVKKIRIPKIY